MYLVNNRVSVDKFDLISLLVGLVGLIIGTFQDLAFSRTITNPDSFIGNFTHQYGEVPGYFLILFALIIMPHTISREQWNDEQFNRHNIYAMGIVLLWLIPSYLIAHRFVSNIEFQLLLTLIIPLPFAYLYRKYDDQIPLRVVKASQITIKFTLIVPLIIVLSLKALWGRVRFYDLSNNASEFTPWYLPQGINGNFSFPSGHAAMAWLMLCSVYFFRDKKQRILVFTIAVLWGIFVSFGRILYGAHYITDVTFSALMSLLIFNYFRKKQDVNLF